MKRYLIDEVKKFIELEARKFERENGKITRAFYDQEELCSGIQQKINVVADLQEWEPFTQDQYIESFDAAVREYRTINPTIIERSVSLEKNRSIWLDESRKAYIGWGAPTLCTYRDRYFEYLKRIGRSEKVIAETERSSLSIVEKLGDPKETKAFFKKGMVVGSVQSGKTANFNGVINSSIDVGYQLIIVLSGIMEDLRVQTQKRIEKDVIGQMESTGIWKGVGSVLPFHASGSTPVINSITSSESDFNRGIASGSSNINGYNILICKKNVSVLKNILLWLKDFTSEDYPQIDVPLLIIDDEADNASLNNMGHRGKEYATMINNEIRAILALFSRKSYLGYTATPFANVLQDRNEAPDSNFTVVENKGRANEIIHEFNVEDNLFPDDFIELLFPPSNYIGIKHFFETRNGEVQKIEPLLAPTLEEEEFYQSFPLRIDKETDEPTLARGRGTRAPKKADDYPNFLPNSLKEAVDCFVLSIAIRLSRKKELEKSLHYQPHHTMLIHISRFGKWQDDTRDKVEDYVETLTRQINNAKKGSTVFEELKYVWDRHFYYIINNIHSHLSSDYDDPYLVAKDFQNDIVPLLTEAIRGVIVKSINSISGDSLYYPSIKDKDFSEKKYIAIGGNRLARGFTLEGLTINYFLRDTSSADTLMQMGRWFGYRPGYLDCCKLFTTQSNIDKFDEASVIIEDLENKFIELASNPSRTPSDFTLWIKNNPGVIKLTRANFLRDTHELTLDFSDTVQQSTQFLIDKEKIVGAYEAFKDYASNRKWNDEEGYLIHDTDQQGLIDLVSLPNVMLNLNVLGLRGYLKNCSESNKLLNWKIAVKCIKNGEGGVLKSEDSPFEKDINLIVRRGPSDMQGNSRDSLLLDNVFKSRNATIISPSDFSISLSPKEKEAAVTQFRKLKEAQFLRENQSKEDAKKNSEKASIPDYAYRSYMDDTTGVAILYLMDLDKVFESEKGVKDEELLRYAEEKDLLGLKLPLIGLALGFPTVRGVDAGNFVTRHLFKELKEMNLEELVDYATSKDLGIDTSKPWTREKLFKAISEYVDDADEFDDRDLVEV